MSSPDFDAPPRDEIQPSDEEVRRSPISRAPHPDEFDGPDDLEIDEEQITRSRIPPAAWPKADAEAPDYAHLEPGGREPLPGAKRFTIGAGDIELLIKANGFDPKGPDSRIVFGLRGAMLVDEADGKNDGVMAGVDTITLEDIRPDHRAFRCTIGYLNRETGKISAFRASTVPNVQYLTNYYMWNNGLGGNSSTGANMLPTGCYVYRMGAHGGGRIYPALRLTNPDRLAEDGQACVLRTKNDLTFKTDDILDHCTPYDNIHCAYAFDKFSSAGCQTIQGPNGEGPWGHFQALLRTMKVNTRIDYVLLTGRDAALAVWLRETGKAGDPEMVAKWLGRLRPGSRGEAVGRLQQQLGMKPSGYFGPSTKKKLGELQRGKGLLADGIWSPRSEEKLGWSIFQAPPQPTAPAILPAPVAVEPPKPSAAEPDKQSEPVAVPAAPAVSAVSPVSGVPSLPAVKPAAPEEVAPVPAAEPASVVAAAVAPAPDAVSVPLPAPAKPDGASAVAAAPSSGILAVVGAVAAVAATTVTAAVTSTEKAADAAPVSPPEPSPAAASGLSNSVLAEMDKLAPVPDGSPEAPGIVDLEVARSPALESVEAGLARSAALAVDKAEAAEIIAPAALAAALVESQAAAPVAAALPLPAATASLPAGGTGNRKPIIDADRLTRFAGDALPQYREALLGGNDTLTRYGIDHSALRLCHFLAYVGVESGRLTILDENLSYRSAQRLRAVWPMRFPTVASAEPFVNNPQKLAEKVYGGRFDNRPGDGWRYRGRGLVQLTGRTAYREIGRKLGIDLENQPERASDPAHMLAIACETWLAKSMPGERDLNRLADAAKIEVLAYRLAGGHAGIDDHREAFEDAWQLWGSGEPPRRSLDRETLERGDRGGRVEELNARLGELGLLEVAAGMRPTSIYSRATYAAVRRLQEEAGADLTGVVTPHTWALIEKSLDAAADGPRAPVRRVGKAANPARSPIAVRMKEIRAWSVALTLLAVGFVASYIYALTHATGNTPLWMPLVFAGMVFVTGLAMLLASQMKSDVDAEGKPDSAKGGSAQGAGGVMVDATHGFVPGEEEPVRLGVNI